MSNYSYIKWATGYEVGHSFKHALLLDSINIGNFFVRINATTGSIINVDSILGSRLKISTVCANSQGGFYLSGTIGNYFKKIAIPNKDTLLSKYNLKHPFLIKYGANDCGKLDVPIWAKENKKIKIYPNPSSDFIIIENAEARSTVRLYNTLGQMLLQTTLSQNQERINIQNLLSGIYIVEFISDDNHIQRTKLMKW
jgi:hypothetical protein